MGWSRLLGLVALAAVVLQARSAAADPAAPDRAVYLERSGCEGARLAEIASMLRVELLTRFVDGSPTRDAYRTAIDCPGDVVVISVGVPGGATKSLQMNLAGAPRTVRSRIVALDIAELVRDLDREPRPVPPVVLPAPIERDEVRLPAPPSSPGTRSVGLGAFAQTSSFELNGVWLAGGGLRFDYVHRLLVAGLDAAMLTADQRFAQGTALVFLAYVSPTVGWQETWGRAQTRLGAGYALGAARLSGRATDAGAFAGTTTGPWTAPYAFAAFALALTDTFSVEARGQLGWVTSPVVGQVSGGADVALEGLWASVQAGLTIVL